MAVLTIPNLSDELVARLRLRAAAAGRSLEAEARAILIEALPADQPRGTMDAASLQEWVDELYRGARPVGVVDDLIAERRREAVAE